MQTTQAYQIVLTNLPMELASQVVIANLWNTISDSVGKELNVYVTATITEGTYACGKNRNCITPVESTIMIETIRNPAFYTEEDNYERALLRIIDQLRKVLDEPFLSLHIYEVNFIYLEPRTE